MSGEEHSGAIPRVAIHRYVWGFRINLEHQIGDEMQERLSAQIKLIDGVTDVHTNNHRIIVVDVGYDGDKDKVGAELSRLFPIVT